MTKVTIVLEVDRYACTEIEDMRRMYQTRDFSGMMASLERLQQHCTAMEDALHSNKWKELFHKADIWDYEKAKDLDIKSLVKENNQ